MKSSTSGTHHRESQSGQTIIFFAIVLSFLVMTLGLAIEAGRLFTDYRRMQSAADMAALAGAQSLPNSSTALSDACQYAQDNGYGGSTCSSTGTATTGVAGWVGASTATTTVSIPPVSQSPYSMLSYNSHYIEVTISVNVGTVPIFNVPVTLSVHSIARQGIPGIVDFALVALDPTSVNGISLSGSNGIITHGSIESNSTNVSSTSGAITTGGSGTNTACEGQWYTVANETDPGHLATYVKGTVAFAPPGCSSSSGADSPDLFNPRSGSLADPYGTTVAPYPSSGTTNMPDCTGSHASAGWCNNSAASTYFLDQNKSTGVWSWHTASETNQPKTSGDTLELFPGYYPNGLTASGGSIYFNPGVYRFGNDFKVTGGNLCVYGAPVCDVGNCLYTCTSGKGYLPTSVGGGTLNCSTTTFKPGGAVDAKNWYYFCSPWGFWDGSDPTGTGRPSSLPTTPPTFSDGIPLNGVTIFLDSNKPNVDIEGSGALSLAFPNPCAGHDAGSAGSGSGAGATAGSADFPQGATSNVYQYPTGSLPALRGQSAYTGTVIYPDADLTSTGDQVCTNPGLVWTGEFGATETTGEHLNFLFYGQNNGSNVKLAGSAQENWYGIIHTFPCSSVPCTRPPTAACGSGSATCSVTITGSSGGSNGPPMLFGQIIGDTVGISGSSLVEVFDRPGGEASGPGSSLVQ